MINYSDFFHVGLIVADIRKGLKDIARRFGTDFPDPREANVRIRWRGQDQSVPVKFAYSRQGPPFLEVIEAIPGTVWEATQGSRIHHLGVFCNDLENEIGRLQAEGYEYEAASLGPDGSLRGAQYINNESGIRLELLDGRSRELFLNALKG